jgi:catechol 2,3-dioxygenase-like lactoylglutathione lyase family enzyme
MGVYLQSEERAKTDGAQGLPTYSFTTTPEGMNEVASELNKLGFSFEEPAKNSLPFANRALFFADPAGNHYAIYTSQTTLANSGTHSDRMSDVGYLELEAPELEASVRFYKQVLGFDFLAYSEHPILRSRRATMLMASGQTLILTESAFKPKGLVMSRSVPGPHIAFYIPATRWRDALAHLDELRIPNGDRGAAKERVPGGNAGTYMDDPAGYVIQYITDGME